MLKAVFIVLFIWMLVMLTIQSVRQASGKDLMSWAKATGIGLAGAGITGILVFILVNVF